MLGGTASDGSWLLDLGAACRCSRASRRRRSASKRFQRRRLRPTSRRQHSAPPQSRLGHAPRYATSWKRFLSRESYLRTGQQMTKAGFASLNLTRLRTKVRSLTSGISEAYSPHAGGLTGVFHDLITDDVSPESRPKDMG